MSSPRVLVTGALGMLGTDLSPVLTSWGYEVVPADLAELDLTDPTATARFMGANRFAPIVNCAAHTAVDQAERETEIAFRVNRDGAANLARAAKEVGAVLLHLSTDYIFDGTQEGRKPTLNLRVWGSLGCFGRVECKLTTSWLQTSPSANLATLVLLWQAPRNAPGTT